MSAYSGPQGPQSKEGRPNKGVSKARKEQKRLEAERRQAAHDEEKQIEEPLEEIIEGGEDEKKSKKGHKK